MTTAKIAPRRRASASVEENSRNANAPTTPSLHARWLRSYRTALLVPEWQPTIRRLSQRRPAPRCSVASSTCCARWRGRMATRPSDGSGQDKRRRRDRSVVVQTTIRSNPSTTSTAPKVSEIQTRNPRACVLTQDSQRCSIGSARFARKDHEQHGCPDEGRGDGDVDEHQGRRPDRSVAADGRHGQQREQQALRAPETEQCRHRERCGGTRLVESRHDRGPATGLLRTRLGARGSCADRHERRPGEQLDHRLDRVVRVDPVRERRAGDQADQAGECGPDDVADREPDAVRTRAGALDDAQRRRQGERAGAGHDREECDMERCTHRVSRPWTAASIGRRR